MQTALGAAVLETVATYDLYDEAGNLRQVTGKDGIVTTFFWGYKKQYPVAKVVGKSYSSIISQVTTLNFSILDNPSSDGVLQTELDKLRSLSGCLVTTFTYRPLIGLTSEKDPSGKLLSYEYDEFGRLKAVRDQNSNVLNKYDYKYASQ